MTLLWFIVTTALYILIQVLSTPQFGWDGYACYALGIITMIGYHVIEEMKKR